MATDEPRRPLPGKGVRRRHAALAGHEGDERAARALLVDPDPSVRATALAALARLRVVTDDDLASAADDEAAAVRRRAAALLATDPGATRSVSLLALLVDPDASVVEVAAWAAGERHEEQRACGPDPIGDVVERLGSLATGHDDALVREAAVASLGSIGAPSGLPAILHGMSDKVTVRRRAVIALAPFDGPEVDAALEQATTDRDWQVRQAAEDLR
jgi:HEAT repeat protein